MQWISTRGASPPIPFVDALFAGTAPDGGLYMPERLDPLPAGAAGRPARAPTSSRSATVVGAHLLRDEITPRPSSSRWSATRWTFPVPLVQVTDRVWALELFHGPTLAFKDVGARVQARLLHHFTDGTPLTILVATSGDTGSAVAQAFHRVPDTRVVVLYPAGQGQRRPGGADGVDGRQHPGDRGGAAPSTTASGWSSRRSPTTSCARHVWLTPANSINLGRLLPQVFYYFLLAGLRGEGRGPIVAVPSGNFGNLTAGLIAKRIGLPVAQFVAATNVNDAVPALPAHRPLRAAATRCGPWPTRWTSARRATSSACRRCTAAIARRAAPRRRRASPTTTRASSRRSATSTGATATCSIRTAPSAGWRINDALAHAGPRAQGVFLATAHPAKFREVVEPAIGAPVPLPPVLADAVKRPRHALPLRGRLRGAARAAAGTEHRCRHSIPYRPPPGRVAVARPTIPERYRWDLSAICRDWDDWAARATGSSRRRSTRSRAFPGTLANGPADLLAALRAMDDMGALSYRVWYYASLQYDEDQRDNDDQRAAPAGADPVRPPAAGERLVQPRAAGDPARHHPRLDGGRRRRWPSTASRSRACSTSRSTCSTSRASGCCRTPAASTACRTTATRR